VDVAHNDVNSVGAGTGDVLLDGPVSTIPRRYKNSEFLFNGNKCRTFLCKEKTLVCSWGRAGRISVEQQACIFVRDFFLFLSAEMMVLGEKISLLTKLA